MPWSVVAVVALVAVGLILSTWFAWHQHRMQGDAAAVDGHQLTAGSVRVGDRHEVQLVDDSTGRVVARMEPGDAGRLAGELVNAAMLTSAHNPPDEAQPEQP